MLLPAPRKKSRYLYGVNIELSCGIGSCCLFPLVTLLLWYSVFLSSSFLRVAKRRYTILSILWSDYIWARTARSQGMTNTTTWRWLILVLPPPCRYCSADFIAGWLRLFLFGIFPQTLLIVPWIQRWIQLRSQDSILSVTISARFSILSWSRASLPRGAIPVCTGVMTSHLLSSNIASWRSFAILA